MSTGQNDARTLVEHLVAARVLASTDQSAASSPPGQSLLRMIVQKMVPPRAIVLAEYVAAFIALLPAVTHAQEACPPGQFLSSSGGCESCAVGDGAWARVHGGTLRPACATCPAGQFTESPISAQCETCPAGTFTSLGESFTASEDPASEGTVWEARITMSVRSPTPCWCRGPGDEISWEVTDDAGVVQCSGGPYPTGPGADYGSICRLKPGGRHVVKCIDSWGDGARLPPPPLLHQLTSPRCPRLTGSPSLVRL